MKGLKSLLTVFWCNFLDSVMFGTTVGVVLFFLIVLVSIAGGDHEAVIFGAVLLICILVCSAVMCVLSIKRKFHRYDPELLGDSFVGFNRKCRDFRECMDTLFAHMPNRALNGFKAMEDNYGDTMSDYEKGIVCFYIARCYDLLEFYPNAHGYYLKADKLGFQNGVIKFLTARCTGLMGDIEEALNLYDRIISDKSNPLVPFVRTDIGKMYLNANDGANALKWYREAINLHENYAEALGGAAIASLLLHEFPEAEKYYKMAVLNQIRDTEKFSKHYHDVFSMEEKKTAAAE